MKRKPDPSIDAIMKLPTGPGAGGGGGGGWTQGASPRTMSPSEAKRVLRQKDYDRRLSGRKMDEYNQGYQAYRKALQKRAKEQE